MAKDKNDDTVGMDLGELGMIRNILMGQQISEWEVKYSEINQDLEARAQELENLINSRSESADSEMSEMDKAITARLNKLEKNLEKRLDQLEQKLVDSSQKDRHSMGKMLAEMGRKLMEG